MQIYVLSDWDGTPRYIGQSRDAVTRLRQHWFDRDLSGFWWLPKNMWLRTLTSCPPMRVLRKVPKSAVNAAEMDAIRLARKEYPGMMTNLIPVLSPNAPEWAMFRQLAEDDDPDFDWMSFHREKIEWTQERRERTSAGNIAAWDGDEERRQRQSEWGKKLCRRPELLAANIERLSNPDPDFIAARAKGNARQWADPERRARHAEHNRRVAAGRSAHAQAARAEREAEKSRIRSARQAERERAAEARRAARWDSYGEDAPALCAAERAYRAGETDQGEYQREIQRIIQGRPDKRAGARKRNTDIWTPEKIAETRAEWTPERREAARRAASTPAALERSRNAANRQHGR